MAQQRWALVPTAGPFPLAQNNDGEEETLTGIYEEYATLYPNPALQAEREERHRLRQAVAAAKSVGQQQQRQNNKKKGWWGSLWNSVDEDHLDTLDDTVDDDASFLQEVPNDERDDDDEYLCGTSLDLACIPMMAHCKARFYSVSERSHRPHLSRVVHGQEAATVLDLGVFVTAQQGIMYTADRQMLSNNMPRTNWRLSYVRSCRVSANLIVVSWGFRDGVSVLYRRLDAPANQDCHWEPAATIFPAQGQDDDMFDDEEGSIVTDMVPLVVEQNDDDPLISIAISRLGGCIDIVSLPPVLCHAPPKSPSRRRSRQLPKLAVGSSLQTTDYHSDVQALAAMRTSVEEDSPWNTKLYPDTPPAEHVVAATGTRQGHETVSFWSVSTILPEPGQQDDGVCKVVAKLVEAWDLGQVGPDLSVFATSDILRQWRKPRQVQLRDNDTATGTTPESAVKVLSAPAPVVSLRFENDTLALLDANGGLVTLDCVLLERVASQTLSENEYNQIFKQTETVTPLVAQIHDRSAIYAFIAQGNNFALSCIAFEWMEHRKVDIFEGLAKAIALTTKKSIFLVSCDMTEVFATLPLDTGHHRFLFSNESVALVSVDEKSRICFRTIQNSGTREFVSALAADSMYKTAIEASLGILSEDAEDVRDTVDDCRRALWESTRDLTALKGIRDDLYIVTQAMQFGQFDGDESFECFRLVHQIAIERVSSATFGAKIAIGGPDGIDSVLEELNTRVLKAGTYQLLCRKLGVDDSLNLFLEEFLPISPVALAKTFATTMDFAALSIVCYRHGSSTAVVDAIPVSVPVNQYKHLLPMFPQIDFFLDEDGRSKPRTELPSLLFRIYGVDSVMASEVNVGAEVSNNMNDLDGEELSDWYLDRALRTGSFLMSFSYVVDFAEAACAAVSLVSSQSVQSLNKLGRVFSVVLSFLEEQDDFDQCQMLLDPKLDLETLDLTKAVEISLSECSDSVDVYKRYRNLLLPLSHSLVCAETEAQLMPALSHFYQDLVASKTDSAGVRRAVAVASTFLTLSKSDMPASQRIIQCRRETMDFVESLVEAAIESFSVLELSTDDATHLVNSFWSLYECLPVKPNKILPHQPEVLNSLSSRGDDLFRTLVSLDILSCWDGTTAFQVAEQRLKATSVEDRVVVDEVAVSFVCKLFLEQLDLNVSNTVESDKLLLDLISDLNQLETLTFDDGMELRPLVSTHLLQPLFLQGKYHILASCCLRMKEDWLDLTEIAEQLTPLLAQTPYLPQSTEVGELEGLTKCRTVFAGFPELHHLLAQMERMVNVCDFLANKMGSVGFTMVTILQMTTLELIDDILSRRAEFLLFNQGDWNDPQWAQNSNQVLRDIGPKGSPAIRPPEDTILHLVNLLGGSSDELFSGRLRVAEVCRTSKRQGAAAAVLRGCLVPDELTKLTPDQRSSLFLVTAEVVLDVEYLDVATKVELCEHTLRFASSSPLSSRAAAKFQGLLVEYLKIVEFPRNGPPPNAMFSYRRLRHDTIFEYSVDPTDLFSTLSEQIGNSIVDDELLNVLARYCIYWCVAQCTRPKRGTPVPFDYACIHANLSLACSLIFQIGKETKRTECLTHLHSVWSQESAKALESSIATNCNDWVRPNEDIVRRLVHRGYSTNGARRAAATTKNAGFDRALQWAISHSLDPGFDDPLIFVRKRGHEFIDRHGIDLVTSTLEKLRESSSSLLSTSAGGIFESDTGSLEDRTTKLHTPHDGTIAESPSAGVTNIVPLISSSVRKGTTSSISQDVSHRSVAIATSTTFNTKQDANDSVVTTKPDQMAGAVAAKPVVSRTQPPQSPKSAPPTLVGVTTSSMLSPNSRNNMRTRGHEVFRNLRKTTKTADRQRLIEEGRRLLQQARASPRISKPIPRHPPPDQQPGEDDSRSEQASEASGWDLDFDV